MGYSTDFSGKLLFTKELKASELAELNNFLGKDCREHPEWGNANLSYIDLQLTKDFFGLEWDGSEKTYDLVEKTNLVIENMRIKYPDFGLTGKLLAQGEDIGDAWILAIENGKAKHKKIDLSHKKKITCPHCEEEFFLDEEKKYSFSFVFSGFRDIVGGRSKAMETEFNKAKELLLRELGDEAVNLRANAIIGLKIDFEDVGKVSGNAFMLLGTGTGVIIE